MCVLIISTTFVWNTSHSKKWARYDQKCIMVFHVKYPLLLIDINETWFCKRILEKYSNIKFHKNPSSENRLAPCRQRDGQTWWSLWPLFAILRTRLKSRCVSDKILTKSIFLAQCFGTRILYSPTLCTGYALVFEQTYFFYIILVQQWFSQIIISLPVVLVKLRTVMK
jgi:hypothetical protein